MITYPNIKINIGLNITRKRSDGFHDLETIFYPVDNKKDKLEINISKTGTLSLKILNNDLISCNDDNLCLKAYHLIKAQYDIPAVDIVLTKNIPVGAGLGGGSSDAAFTLRMLNDLFDLHLSEKKLKEYASQLGSDVAFFIDNKPAFATGRGEILEPIELDLSRKVISVITPDIAISTAEAYSAVLPEEPEISLKELIKLPLSEWKNHIVNDFEKSVFQKYPQLKEIKDELYRKGADYASLSGSGSSLYAIADFGILKLSKVGKK